MPIVPVEKKNTPMAFWDEFQASLGGQSEQASAPSPAPAPASSPLSLLEKYLATQAHPQLEAPVAAVNPGIVPPREGLFGFPTSPAEQESFVASSGNPNIAVRKEAEKLSNFDNLTANIGMGLNSLVTAAGGGFDFFGLDSAGGFLKDHSKKRIEEIRGQIPPASLKEMDTPLFIEDEEGGFLNSGFSKNPDATFSGFAGKVAQQIPNIVASVGTGLGLAKGITALGTKLFPKLAAKTVAKGGGALGLGASEGGIELGFAKAEIEDAINQAPLEVLQGSPGYQKIYNELISNEFSPGDAEREARALLADALSQSGATKVGITTALLGAPLGAYLNVLKKFKSTGRLARGGVAGVAEGLQETAQEGIGSVIKEVSKSDAGLEVKQPGEIVTESLEAGVTAGPLGTATGLAVGSGTTPEKTAGDLLGKRVEETTPKQIDDRIEGVESINEDELETFAQGTAVVDDKGKPLEVFHGTTKNFEEFNLKVRGSTLSKGQSFGAVWFTSDPKDADFFGANGEGQDGLNIRPAFLNMQNPLIMETRSFILSKNRGADHIKRAKAKGHDGIILRIDGKKKKGDQYLVFSNDQIRQRFKKKPEPRKVGFKSLAESQADTTITLTKSPQNPDKFQADEIPNLASEKAKAESAEIDKGVVEEAKEQVRQENADIKQEQGIDKTIDRNKSLDSERKAKVRAEKKRVRDEKEKRTAQSEFREKSRSDEKAGRADTIKEEFIAIDNDIKKSQELGDPKSDITALEIDREVVRKRGQLNRVSDLEKAGQKDKATRLKARIENTESKIISLKRQREAEIESESFADVESRALSSVEKQNKARRIRERLADEESTVNQKGFERQQKRSEKQRRKDAAELEQLERDINALDIVEPLAAQSTQPTSTTDSGDLSTLEANTPQQSPSVGVPQSVQEQENSTDTSTDNIAPVEESFKRDPKIVKQNQTDSAVSFVGKNKTRKELAANKTLGELVQAARNLGVQHSAKKGTLGKAKIADNIFKELKNRGIVRPGVARKKPVKNKKGKSIISLFQESGGLNKEDFKRTFGEPFVAQMEERFGTKGRRVGIFNKEGKGKTVDGTGLFLQQEGLVPENFDADDVLKVFEKIDNDFDINKTTEINEQIPTDEQFAQGQEDAFKKSDEKNRLSDEDFNSLEEKAGKGELSEKEQQNLERAQNIRLREDGFDPNSLAFLGTDQIIPAIKTLMKGYSKGADKLFSRLEGKFEGLSALGSLPDQDKFLKIRNKLGGRLQAVDKIAKDVFDVFTQADGRDQLAVLDFLTEKDASASIIKDKAVRQTAVRVKKTFASSGKQLVSRGLLTQETFEKYQGAYLPRLYLANLTKGDLDAGGMFKLPSGKKVSNFGFLKPRGEIPAEVRDTILGEIKNAGFLAATGLNTELRDLAILDTLDKMATNPDWVFAESVTMWPVKKDGELAKNASPVSVFWLKAQSEKLDAEANRTRSASQLPGIPEPIREQAEKQADRLTAKADLMRTAIGRNEADLANIDLSGLPSAAIRRLGNKASAVEIKNEANRLRDQADFVDETRGDRMLELAETLENLVSPELEGLSEKDFKRVPNNKRYGALQGALINKDIYEDFIESMDSVDTEMGLLEKTTAYWKLSKVALNPPSQVRNFVSNMVLLQLSGIPMRKMPGYFIETLKQMRAKTGKAYNIARRNGIGASTFSSQEMNLLQNEFLKIDGNKEAGYFTKVREMAEAVARIASNAYGGIEAIGKIMKIQDELSKGTSPTDAVIEANKWLFDYSLVPKRVNQLRRLPIGIPFLTFYYKAFPRMVETAVKTPWRFAPYVALSYGMAAAFKAMNDLDDDDLEKLRDILPSYLQGKPGVIPSPFKDANGNWQFIDISYFYPWAQYSQFINTLFDSKPGKIDRLLGTVGLFGGPVPTATAGLTTNIDPFTNKEIVDEGALPGEKIARMFGWLYNIMTPPWLQYGPNGSPEAFKGATQKIIEAYQGKNINKYTNEPKRTITQAWLRMVGLNVYPIDYTQSRKVNLIRMRAEILDKKRSGIRALGNPNKTKEEKAEIREAYTNEIKLLQAQAKEYQKSSKITDPEQKKALLRKDKN